MLITFGFKQLPDPPSDETQSLPERIRTGQWTGLLKSQPKEGDIVLLILFRGECPRAYQIEPRLIHVVDALGDWVEIVSNPSAQFSFLPVDVEKLGLIRIALERSVPVETLTVEPSHIYSLIAQWQKLTQPSLVVLVTRAGQGLLMLWPGQSSPLDAWAVGEGGVREGAEALSWMASPDWGVGEAKRHAFVSDGSAWEQYAFRVMFVRLLTGMLARYKDLTGLTLLNVLGRNLNRVALERHWDFSITLGEVSDRMMFRDLNEQIAASKTLLEVASEHVEVVLGQKLSRTLIQSAIAGLDEHSVRLVRKFSIDAFLQAPRSAPFTEERSHD